MHFVISDIHGCFYTLQKLLDQIYKLDKSPQIVFVGDYVDRGLRSKQVVDLVIDLQLQGAICLRGNHDDVLDQMLNSSCESDLRHFICAELTLSNIAAWWYQNGLGPTIQSYVPNVFDLEHFIQAVPLSHKQFFRSLKMHWEIDTHFACHGYLDPSQELPRKLDFLPSSLKTDMLWSRFPALHLDGGTYGATAAAGVECCLPLWDKIGIFGHTPVSSYGAQEPIKHGNLRLIDTAAFKGRFLTAYVCETDDFILQATESNDIR